MIRLKNRLGNVVFIALIITATLSLAACGSKKKTTSEPGEISPVVSQPSGDVSGDGMTAEEREQFGQRDPGYIEESKLENVYFDYDKSDLRADTRDILKSNAEWVKANPGTKIQIEGHCDERGTEEYNLALGERRANSVKNYLVSLGISAERLFTISYGEELPEDPRHVEEAWAKNRRAHFLVTK